MEKIKSALAKARLQHAEEKKTLTVESRVDHKISSTESELDKIVYHTTPVIKLDLAHLEKNRIVSHLKNNANSAVFDSLRTQVLQKMEENNWHTIAVVSPTPESGKTFTAINLAISIAHQPQKTAVLVDFDLRRPRVASYLGAHTEKSLNDYLADKAELKDVIFNPNIPKLVVLPTAKHVTRSAEVLSSKKVANLIDELKNRYESRIVIFDSPPVLNTDDAIVLFKQVDCILLVVASGLSTQKEIEDTLFHLPKEKLVGLVVNKADIEAKSYYY